jgi:hypothetical protein
LGKDKRTNKNNARQEKRWNYPCRPKATFPVNESPVGGKKKSRRQINRPTELVSRLLCCSWAFAKEAG